MVHVRFPLLVTTGGPEYATAETYWQTVVHREGAKRARYPQGTIRRGCLLTGLAGLEYGACNSSGLS